MKSRHALPVLVFFLGTWMAGPVTAREPAAGPPPLPENIREAMQDRHYAEAVQAIDAALRAQAEPGEYLAYLKGWALCLDGQFEPAAAALEQFEQRYPQSPWASRARLARGVALARKGDFRGAEQLYRAEAQRLLSDERQQDLADLYLGDADAAFRPAKADEKPDYARALEFYRKALELCPPSEKRAEIHLRVAECLQKTDRLQEAAECYLQFSRDYPKSPLDVEARYRAGECFLALHDARQARRIWQDLLALTVDAPSARVADAQFHLAETWGMPKPATAVDLSLGIAALETFLERFPDHQQAGAAFLSMAQGYAEQQRYDDVVRVLDRFLDQERYQQSKEIPEARWLLGQAYQLQQKYPEALAAWRDYLSKHPSGPRWSTIQQEVVNTEYLMGQAKYEAHAYDEALRLWNEFLARYPLDSRAPEILVQFGRMYREQKRFDAALDEWQRVVSKYPKTDSAAEAQWSIAMTLEESLGQLDKALEKYEKISEGPHVQDAVRAAARLKEKSLTLATERVFRSDETPKLKLTTRNLEAVTVRVYQVDLETYFRKMHQAGNLEPLNVALIDPDRSWEFSVPQYAKYQLLENEIEVPLPAERRAGVLAVTVSSKTLEATTLVLQSDLDLIVKSSRDELFVLAENMRTGKPWPGVRLLISNGQQILAEATTNAQGVLQQALEGGKDTAELRVFGVLDEHVASTDLSLQGVKTAERLSDKGYLFTDRPAYQPGDRVHVRGCLRQTSRDTYTVTPDRPYTLTVLDERNRELWRQEVALGPFGSFQAALPLPATSAPGSYRILAQDRDGRSYTGSFQVYAYQLEPIRLVVDTPRRVYYRGEEIQGTIRATYAYGAPLVGRELSYQLADDRVYRATTDAQGEVQFKLPTREFQESQALPLVVTLLEDDLTTTANFVLAQQAFSIGLSTARPVFLAGETFELVAQVRDAEDHPLAQACTLKVLEQSCIDGKLTQRPVAEHALTTSDEGTGRLTLKLDKGGRYLLRAEATDRFQNPVSQELTLDISAPEDATRLRILAEQHTYRVGDTAAVRVHWREEPALALVAFQTARVLDYQLVELKTGDNELSIPMTTAMAPNFELSVAVMSDVRTKPADDKRPVVRFHHVSSPFTVQRELKVEVTAQRTDGTAGPIRPGEEVTLRVRTTDPQGKPVAAEVSVALVQQTLLDRFGWPMPPIQEFFRGIAQESPMRTASSIVFACRPKTTPINARLLAEEERRELAEAEETSRRAAAREVSGGGFGDGQAPASPAFSPPPPREPVPHESEALFADTLGSSEDPFGFTSPAKRKQREAAPPLPDLSQETGYWNPSLVTGADGQATVTFRMPELSTAWSLVAKGITTETLVGETAQPIVATKELFGQLRLPAAFTDGDQAEIGALVENHLVAEGSIEVTLKTTIGSRTVEEHKTLEAKPGTQPLSFKTQPFALDGATSGQATVELIVTAGDHRDVSRQTVPILPYGRPVFAAASGSATSDTAVWVEPPREMTLQSPSLLITLFPTIENDLLQIVSTSDNAPWCKADFISPGTPVERATSDLMAALALQKLVKGPAAATLDGKVRAALALLIAAQNQDGGWSWTGQKHASRVPTTARTVWALSRAKAAGYRVPDDRYQLAVAYLKTQLTITEADNTEARALLLHALATAGQGDFALANHLYRDRTRLSSAGLVYLALAFAEMDRKAIAAELLGLLEPRNLDSPSDDSRIADLPWNAATVELRALATLAGELAGLPKDKLQAQIDWLLAHRAGVRWSPDTATGPATMALAHWFAETREEGQRYRIAISVNDQPTKVVDIDPLQGPQSLEVPASQLKPGKQQIRFQLTGRGRYSFQCLLSGHVPADQLKSTTTDWRIERTCEPAPRELDGRAIPRGFSILQGPITPFRNPLAQLPVGKRGVVELRLSRSEEKPQAKRPEEYFVLTEPIPCGARVLENTIHGSFEHYEIGPAAITFYLGEQGFTTPIRYELAGSTAGIYRTAPTVLRNAYRPEQITVARAEELTVLPRGVESRDPYRLSPDELYYLGTRLAAKGEKQQAEQHLRTLVETWSLTPAAYQKTLETLLDLHLDLGPAERVVHDFEIVKEKWPDLAIPFHRIVQVGAAYEAMQEYERAYLVFRATLESSFLRDSGVAGFLDQKGDFLKSVEVMEQLLREYPPEPYLAAAQFGLSQQISAKAAEAASDPKLREAKVNRIDLMRRSWSLIERLLTEFPDDPAADQAAFSAAHALVEMEDFAHAADACRRYAERYPESRLVDSFWYILGYCQFAQGQTDEALQMCQKVSEAEVVNPETGQTEESPNKWQAIYILGQIYHSLGRGADAVREYQRVEDRFPDAKQAAAYFLRKTVVLPEVTTVKPGEAVNLELKYRNLTQCDVKVYRVDLLKYGLLEGSLGGIARINLAGIRPQWESTVPLQETSDYRERTHQLSLELKKEGAYLVVCRGENLHTSGLVLVTPLALEVQTDAQAGQVRVTIKDATSDSFVHKAQIRVIGAGNEDFVSGTSDLRGVFVANGIHGRPTVLAEAGPGRYAFFRSPGAFQLPPPVPATVAAGSPSAPELVAREDNPLAWTFLSKAELHIREVLEQPTTLVFSETPLSEVIAWIKARHQIEVQLDTKALEEQAISPDLPITIDIQGVSLRSALRTMLRPHGLAYMLRDDALTITTPEQASENLITEFYSVEDLVPVRTQSGEMMADYDSLIALITGIVAPITWEEVGGTGTIAPFESRACLVISQTPEVHKEINDFLKVMRKMPIKDRPLPTLPSTHPSNRLGTGEMMGGMGGGMGGFGGPTPQLGGAAPAASEPRRVPLPSRQSPQAAANADLLGGLKQSQERFQRQQVEQLHKMYQGGMGGGMGGVSAGAAGK